jgi:hypothetical protein
MAAKQQAGEGNAFIVHQPVSTMEALRASLHSRMLANPLHFAEWA